MTVDLSRLAELESLFIGPDANDEPTLWQHNPERPDFPHALLQRCESPTVFDALALIPDLLARLQQAEVDRDRARIHEQQAKHSYDELAAIHATAEARLARVEAVLAEWDRLLWAGVLVYASRYIADLAAALAPTTQAADIEGASHEHE